MTDTMVEEQCQQQGLSESSYSCAVVCPWEKKEEILPLLSKEAIPLLLTEEAKEEQNNLPLPPNSVHILPTPAAQSTPKTPTTKATPSLPALQNLKKVVATVRASATTSKTQAATHIAWHNGWFGCWFRFGAPEPRHF